MRAAAAVLAAGAADDAAVPVADDDEQPMASASSARSPSRASGGRRIFRAPATRPSGGVAQFTSCGLRRSRFHRDWKCSRPTRETDFASCRFWAGPAGPGVVFLAFSPLRFLDRCGVLAVVLIAPLPDLGPLCCGRARPACAVPVLASPYR